MPGYIPDRVHLVGSIGLDTVEEVFRTVGPELGRVNSAMPAKPGRLTTTSLRRARREMSQNKPVSRSVCRRLLR